MHPRLPLYGRILAWFFLNLLVVGAVVVGLFNAEFTLNLEWFFAVGARERLESVRNLIVEEMNTTAPEDWPGVLRRYSDAYKVRFAIFDDEERPFVGEFSDVPDQVRERMKWRLPPGFRPPQATPQPADSAAPPQRRGPPRFPIRALLRTTHPTEYWLLTSAMLNNPRFGDPMRVILVVRANTISAGGLIFDPNPWFALAVGVVVFSLLFWFPLVRGITRAIGKMMHATRQIADGRLDVRVKMRRHDELGRLGDSIDEMAARLEGLVTGQKRFLADIAHELCSPVARLQMALGILEQRAPAEQAKYVRAASERAEQIAGLVGELLSFSKASFGASAVQLESVNLAATAAEVLRREKTESTDVRLEIPNDLFVAANSDLLIRALSNVVRNAIQHAGAAGPITLRTERSGEEVLVTVADSGAGVPADELPKIFDAFYRIDTSRTRDTGGTGLGLAIVKTCIESCCGSVSARNREPRGLEVVIRLHSAAPEQGPAGSQSLPHPATDAANAQA
jgi:two-component system sensor histidine kinase CpxA